MDKRAFKQRMQNLKSYRENNPGKGYWDWKVEAFAEGGQTGDPSMQAIEQRTWLNNWLKNRSKQMSENIDFYSNQTRYGSSKDRAHVSPFFFQDKEKNASKIIQEQLQHANNTAIYDYREPWVSSNKNIPNRKEFLKMNSNVQGAYHKKYGQPNTISISPITKDRSVILHELSHSTQDKYSIQSSKIDSILKKYVKENNKYDKYYDNPDEVYSRMNQFRYDNNIKPEDIITKDQIEQWKDSSIDNEFINRYSTNTLLDLLNSVAHTPNKKVQRAAEGGVISDPEKERFYQATGRSSSGRPLEEGLKPVFSLEDAANMTPIGDAISAKDAYDAVKNKDWLGAGLAAVTMIPFVPTTVRNFRKKYKGVTPKREIPTVNKKAIDNAIDEAKNYRDSRIKLYQQAIEDRNASYERLIENEDALRRAVNFDKKYGTNYVKTYTKQLQDYAKSKNSPDLMQIGIKPMGANGSFDPNIPDYVFINSDYVKNGKLQPGLISHEKSHYDNQKAGALSLPIFDNRFVDTKKTKTMYPKTYDWIQRYLHNFEETKSHMNEFRTNMINKNLLKPDSKVGLKQIKDLIFNSDNDNMKKLFNTYKSKRQFVKDFNSVPITSIGDNKTLV